MPIEFRCPGCQKLLRVPDESAGRKAQCPECQSVVDIPSSMAAGGPSSGGAPSDGGRPGDARSDDPFAGAGAGGAAAGFDPSNPYQSPQADDMDGFAAGMGRMGEVGEGAINPQIIELGEVFERSWAIFKDQMGITIGVVVLSGVINNVVGQIAAVVIQENLAIGFLLQLASMAVGVFLYTGVLTVLLKVARGQNAQIGDLFSGGRHFWRMLGVIILMYLAVLAGCVLLIVPGILIGLILCFAPMLVIDQNAGVFQSFSLSDRVTRGNRMTLFLLMLASMGLGIAGALACLIGMLFTIPFVYLTWVVAYLMATGQPTAGTVRRFEPTPTT